MLEVKYKIWLDRDGKVFGKGPYCLLKGIKDKGSLSESAKSMGMSYNKAYNLIKDIEDKLGFKLLTSRSGGTKGGGSSLTKEAESLIRTYEKFFYECEQSIHEIFDKHFKGKDLSDI
jgi:molybdate transport system regulatory protein